MQDEEPNGPAEREQDRMSAGPVPPPMASPLISNAACPYLYEEEDDRPSAATATFSSFPASPGVTSAATQFSTLSRRR
jgi:hypothetical protein